MSEPGDGEKYLHIRLAQCALQQLSVCARRMREGRQGFLKTCMGTSNATLGIEGSMATIQVTPPKPVVQARNSRTKAASQRLCRSVSPLTKQFKPARILLGQETVFGVILDEASTGYPAGCGAFRCSCAGCSQIGLYWRAVEYVLLLRARLLHLYGLLRSAGTFDAGVR